MGSIVAELVDTGEKHDSRGRRMTPAERRAQLVEAYRSSGMTMTAFARREGVKYPTFAAWVLKSGRRRSRRLPMRFAEVKLPVPVPTSFLEVRLADGTLLRGGNPVQLAALVKALRA